MQKTALINQDIRTIPRDVRLRGKKSAKRRTMRPIRAHSRNTNTLHKRGVRLLDRESPQSRAKTISSNREYYKELLKIFSD